VELSRRGWRTGEPDPVPREESLAFTKLLARLAQKGEGVRELAEAIFVAERDVRELIPVAATARTPTDPSQPDRLVGHLRVVG
jgi:hypothetical protein